MGEAGGVTAKGAAATVLEIDTPHGPARANVHPTRSRRARWCSGTAPEEGVDAPDLVAATNVALVERFSVALVEQPYVVAGRRSPLARPGSTRHGRRSSIASASSCRTCRWSPAAGLWARVSPAGRPPRPGR